MLDWYGSVIVESGRQPLFLALVAFVLTFITTRIITRLIRSGRGPFKNVSAGGVHVHHVVPGIIAVLIGGLLGFATSLDGPLRLVGAVIFGCGAALVLDEFAMILHLDDVYWEQEGRLSADAVLIAVAVMAVALLLAAPQDPPGPPESDPYVAALIPIFVIVLWVLPITVTIMKGKLFLGAVSLAFAPIAWFTAARLAKPNSPWAQFRYRNKPQKRQRSIERYARLNARWRPLRNWVQEHIFGFDSSTKPEAQTNEATKKASE